MTQAVDSIAADNRASTRHTSTPSALAESRGAAGGGATAQIISLPELDAAAEGGRPVLEDWNPLHQIKATLQACVGQATITVGELLGARERQVLRLDSAIDQPIDLTIEGKVVARGQLVAVDGHFAVRITELPVSLDLAKKP
ncbi:FliM/FliN family flagellar motor C-terminal domain-containing protein [Variovorax arabinosiphilus]|uniref:FliM/FliN family flagellar motor C-terminal domain-containing protein n=1 Tax=Variovorax arabinosiphilus TaxID=3053498 RepID=UPI002575CF3F|nr:MULTISPECIES: FliM/FliN family flagellar motor C-terminal domain-containing protein [unclassified Variovorax]MDM0122199.1 FliM/FliN family flagellar motor C-terminal domain-containing protein [Variovorax sp. J2L1-78]MDM0131272.1 FliM/FliN family flagellar motor C-terminal domain-containing protein [Variovorax sp. J2L1-63]MDM0234962.1 FliM/FliN family flagellar motor C-terminal domain-containing protein [Variovorax sp. J2R1-6]